MGIVLLFLAGVIKVGLALHTIITNKGTTAQTADKYKVLETMNKIVLEFFNSYVKGEGRFQTAETY